MVVLETEQARWQQLGIDYMSEESDDSEDPQSIIVHQLKWRSKRQYDHSHNYKHQVALPIQSYHSTAGLTDFLRQLDERYEARVKKEGTAMVRKIRKIGSSSCGSPTADAPAWLLETSPRGSYTQLALLLLL